MDTSGNEKVSQKELRAYINSLYGVGQEKEAQAYYDAFYDGWEKTKVVWDDKKKEYVVKK